MIQNSKGTQKETLDKNKASQNMPWWVEATRCLFPIVTEIPQHVGRRKKKSGSFTTHSFVVLVSVLFSEMVGAVRRGRTLLSAPIAFQPAVTSSFPWTTCVHSATAGWCHSFEKR